MIENFDFRYKTFVLDTKNSKIIFHSLIGDDKKHSERLRLNDTTMTDKFIERARQKRLRSQSINEPNDQFAIKNIEMKKSGEENSSINKEIGNVWGFETSPEKLPSKEEREMMDRRYSKQILGE